jgi:hypothetical protein
VSTVPFLLAVLSVACSSSSAGPADSQPTGGGAGASGSAGASGGAGASGTAGATASDLTCDAMADFTPCGGDLLGTWTLRKGCDWYPAPSCPGKTVTATHDFQGATVTFAAQQVTSTTGTDAYAQAHSIPLSCITPPSTTCPMGDAPVGDSCVGTGVQETQPYSFGAGHYSYDGIFLRLFTTQQLRYEVCVQGNEARLALVLPTGDPTTNEHGLLILTR